MTGDGRLAGRVALVTGGGRGLGLAVAQRYAREGALVAIAELDRDRAREAAAALGESGIGIQCDVSRADDVERAFDACLERFERIDVLVNNAAVVGPAVRHFLDLEEQTWDLVLNANLKGHYLCTARAARHMVEQGSGVILNTSSGGASRAHRGMVAYDAAKGGVEAFTRAVALDLAPYGVRCVCIVPGLMETSGQGPAAEERARATAATVPLGRQGTGADIAGAAVFLAGDDAGYLTGSCVYVDGGVLSQQRSPQVETFPLDRFPRVGRLAR
jgi:NAD(P)-dependent dehydrogenase (short-subunit alcohol dehydrogenase family)